MKFTKAQRHKIYKDSLHLVEGGRFICGALRDIIKRQGQRQGHWIYFLLQEIPDFFPEFKRKKPKDSDNYIGWWPGGDIDSRVKALKACIRETAPKKRLNKPK